MRVVSSIAVPRPHTPKRSTNRTCHSPASAGIAATAVQAAMATATRSVSALWESPGRIRYIPNARKNRGKATDSPINPSTCRSVIGAESSASNRSGISRGFAMPRTTATATNTAVLFASGVLLYVGQRRHQRHAASAANTVLAACVLGAAFVLLQGREWVGLIAEGLTVRSSALGAFFYLIVGAHGLHAVGALLGLGFAWWRLRQGTLSPGFFLGAQTFWYFVVGVWPVIYGRVYF